MSFFSIKAAFFTYPSAFQNIGGGEIQLLKTKEYLEREGVTVDLFDLWKHRIEDYDLLHIFGSVKECLGLARTAKANKTAVLVSPVFWSDLRRALFADGSALERTGMALRHLTKVLCPFFPSSRRKLLSLADGILPNSEMERRQIARLFAIPLRKIHVVPNAVEASFAAAEIGAFRFRFGQDPFILSVGRIEPRKNQLNLIRAIRRMGRRLVLIGSAVSGTEAYDARCRLEGEGFTTFIPTLGHDDPLLASAYAACEIFVLPAWFETPGLAALEAALAGCRVAVTSGGSTREYFGEEVDYLNPADVADIQAAIQRALQRTSSSALRARVLENFTWKQTARKTLEVYQSVLRSQ